MSASHLHGHALLNETQRAECRQRSDLMGAYLVAHAWGVIAGAMAWFAWWPHPISFLVCWAVIGGRQLGLAILMHDASHRLLFDSPRLNDWVGKFLCGAPVGADLALYRPYHLQHHRHTQSPQDPDLELSAPFPISKASLVRKIRRDLLGITGYQRRADQFRLSCGEGSRAQRWKNFWRAQWPFVLSNSVVAAILITAGVGELFLLLWCLPLLTWYQLASRIRNIAEHAVVGPSHLPMRNTRTTLARWWERILWAPYWVNYHLEHHLVIYCPCWKLARLHRWLIESGWGPQMELTHGYATVLRLAASKPDDSISGGRKSQAVRSL